MYEHDFRCPGGYSPSKHRLRMDDVRIRTAGIPVALRAKPQTLDLEFPQAGVVS